MIEFEITPYLAVGPLKLGMSRETVRKVLGGKAEAFMKSQDSSSPADSFNAIHVHVHYHASNYCVAVEFFGPEVIPTFRGQQLLGLPYNQMDQWLKKIDPDVKRLASGSLSLTFGFGLSTTNAIEASENPVESVIVFEKDYYDKLTLDFLEL